MPVLHLIAGPGGAGKSTLYRTLIAPRYPALPLAASEDGRMALLAQGQDFATETVFSHPSELDLLARARMRGFDTALYVVCVDEPRQLIARVRYQRTLALLQEAVAFAELSLLFHASDVAQGGPALVASIAAGRMHLHTALRPRWAEKLLGFAER
jgi:predicted ABC-type ATPase